MLKYITFTLLFILIVSWSYFIIIKLRKRKVLNQDISAKRIEFLTQIFGVTSAVLTLLCIILQFFLNTPPQKEINIPKLVQPIIIPNPPSKIINPKDSSYFVIRVVEGKTKKFNEKIFEVLIENRRNKSFTLSHFVITYRYKSGITSSISKGELVKPIAKYSIELPINVFNDKERNITHPLDYPIYLPSPVNENISLTSFQLHLFYSFEKGNYHPSSGWDIIFSLDLVTTENEKIELLKNRNWN